MQTCVQNYTTKAKRDFLKRETKKKTKRKK